MPSLGGKVTWVFRDRAQAGEVLAGRLASYAHRADVTVLALPRGGVPVAFPVAWALGAPLDILAVRKLGVPGQEELAMGAIATGGVRVLNHEVVLHLGISPDTIDAAVRTEESRLADQELRFRGDRLQAPLQGRQVVLVDDGLATGSTMEAAIVACRSSGVARVVVAVPVGAPATVAHLATLAEDVVCPEMPRLFRAVGLAYGDFSPVDDAEVMALLEAAGRRSQP